MEDLINMVQNAEHPIKETDFDPAEKRKFVEVAKAAPPAKNPQDLFTKANVAGVLDDEAKEAKLGALKQLADSEETVGSVVIKIFGDEAFSQREKSRLNHEAQGATVIDLIKTATGGNDQDAMYVYFLAELKWLAAVMDDIETRDVTGFFNKCPGGLRLDNDVPKPPEVDRCMSSNLSLLFKF